jgi:predicted HicB family RNase H-like nuclease
MVALAILVAGHQMEAIQMATAYTIRDFPEDLHRRAKATAAMEGVSLRELILKALQLYVEDSQKKGV